MRCLAKLWQRHSLQGEKGGCSEGRQFPVSSVKWKIFIPLAYFTFSWNHGVDSDFLQRTGFSSGQSSDALQQTAKVQALHVKICTFLWVRKWVFYLA